MFLDTEILKKDTLFNSDTRVRFEAKFSHIITKKKDIKNTQFEIVIPTLWTLVARKFIQL